MTMNVVAPASVSRASVVPRSEKRKWRSRTEPGPEAKEAMEAMAASVAARPDDSARYIRQATSASPRPARTSTSASNPAPLSRSATRSSGA
jgi:hypothetical protein